jgi:hypothetical protein
VENMNKQCICPDCGKQLKFMSGYHQGDTYIALFHCEECKDGIDSDWEVTYTEENKIKIIRRYFFG